MMYDCGKKDDKEECCVSVNIYTNCESKKAVECEKPSDKKEDCCVRVNIFTDCKEEKRPK